MKMRGVFSWSVGLFLLGCGQSSSQGPQPSASTVASSASIKPSVQRKTTPAALRVADEQACLAGKADACRRMADRYRGYGHPAGCGLEREASETAHGQMVEPMRVRIKRTIDDTVDDEKAFLVWIGKACDAGNSEACILEKAIREERQSHKLYDLEDAAIRSDPLSSALIGFHALWASAEEHAKFLEKRRGCLLRSKSDCLGLSATLTARIQQEKRPEFTPELLAKLQNIGDRSLDFGSLFMMLDKHGYSPETLAPLKAGASKTLLRACEEGACVCGDAAQSLPPDDPRVVDLARWGCENGEVAGCFMLGKLHEEGRGVEKDELFARSLYEMACPATRSSEVYTWADYSPAACARLAELAAGGTIPAKDEPRAVYYAEFTCRNPGIERDHGYCVKAAQYWTSGFLSKKCSADDRNWCPQIIERAQYMLHGPKSPPEDGKECERPSVKAACDALEPEVAELKKRGEEKK